MKAEPRVAAAVYYVVTVMLYRPYMPVSPTGSLETALVSYAFLVIPMILPFYFWDKTRQERIIAGSGVDWVIVRPGALTDGSKRGRLRHGSRVGSFL